MSERLNQIVARLERSTPGPWERLAGDQGRRIRSQPAGTLFGQRAALVARILSNDPHADAVLIASAPTDLFWVTSRLSAVLDLHCSAGPATRGPHKGQRYCAACTAAVDDVVLYVPWPCQTVRLIDPTAN